jgi:multiple sugar transport system substrate-binding protein
MPRKILLLVLIIFSSVTLAGCGVGFKTPAPKKSITLNYWRVHDGPDAFTDIIAKYRQIHPNITINYKKLRFEEYESALLNAFAEDRAPDIFSIQGTWIKKYINKIQPLPAQTTLDYQTLEGAIKKEVVWTKKTSKSMTPKRLKEAFTDTVSNDVVYRLADKATKKVEEKIVAVPLSVDTLAMYYNRDLLDGASITKIPEYWNNEFLDDVKKLTKQDKNGMITQSGAGLGGSLNIERYSDILTLLMMQNGATMMEGERILFNTIPTSMQEQKRNPGLEALRFYSDFANNSMEVYSWNDKLENSLEMFYNGRLAIFFGYAYHLPVIKSQNPKLNFSIAKFPQIEGNSKPVNFANYWVETVSFKTKAVDAAWDFLQFAAKEENVKTYLAKTKRPTALRSYINQQSEDQDIGVFASQVLTARSWYKGNDSATAEQLIGQMISEISSSSKPMLEILNTTASKVQQTVNSTDQ